MYQIGDRVVYGIHGVCQIVDIEEKRIDRKRIQYYILLPLEQQGSRFMVPVHNQTAVSKMKRLLSQTELDALLRSDETKSDVWIQDENQRKLRYRELINSGDRAALLSMIESLYRHKEAQAAAGRKFHLCDENFLRDAEKLLSSEFSIVLGIRPDQVGEYIRSVMN